VPLDKTFGDGDLIKGRGLAIEDRVHPSARADDRLQQRITGFRIEARRSIWRFAPPPMRRGNACGLSMRSRVDDRCVISGIVHVIKSGGRWIDAPPEYGPKKTLYNRYVRWAAKGVGMDLFHALAQAGGPPVEVLIDSSADAPAAQTSLASVAAGPPRNPSRS
jgi:transposase